MWRLKTLALISKAKKNIIVIFILNERKIYNVMLVTIRQKVVIGTKFAAGKADLGTFEFCPSLGGFRAVPAHGMSFAAV